MLSNMTKTETDDRNRAHCKTIADTLDAIVNGDIWTCPECGKEYRADELSDDGQIQEFDIDSECPDCGCTLEQASLYDYMTDVYNTQYIIDGNRDLVSVRYMVACGGPNIWLDTDTGNVELYWWSDRASYPLSNDVIAELDEMARTELEA